MTWPTTTAFPGGTRSARPNEGGSGGIAAAHPAIRRRLSPYHHIFCHYLGTGTAQSLVTRQNPSTVVPGRLLTRHMLSRPCEISCVFDSALFGQCESALLRPQTIYQHCYHLPLGSACQIDKCLPPRPMKREQWRISPPTTSVMNPEMPQRFN
jgi:hypothetical protein